LNLQLPKFLGLTANDVNDVQIFGISSQVVNGINYRINPLVTGLIGGGLTNGHAHAQTLTHRSGYYKDMTVAKRNHPSKLSNVPVDSCLFTLAVRKPSRVHRHFWRVTLGISCIRITIIDVATGDDRGRWMRGSARNSSGSLQEQPCH
ncbi:hypothetical protein CLF_113287, partial [Clonorchis sinensis]